MNFANKHDISIIQGGSKFNQSVYTVHQISTYILYQDGKKNNAIFFYSWSTVLISILEVTKSIDGKQLQKDLDL